jgi:para-nitrobenzyl esterase
MMRTLWIAAIATLSLAAAMARPVKVAGGQVDGTVENGLTVYRGIPFAASPVGDLRWKAPQPAASWQGVRKASSRRAACNRWAARRRAA